MQQLVDAQPQNLQHLDIEACQRTAGVRDDDRGRARPASGLCRRCDFRGERAVALVGEPVANRRQSGGQVALVPSIPRAGLRMPPHGPARSWLLRETRARCQAVAGEELASSAWSPAFGLQFSQAQHPLAGRDPQVVGLGREDRPRRLRR